MPFKTFSDSTSQSESLCIFVYKDKYFNRGKNKTENISILEELCDDYNYSKMY